MTVEEWLGEENELGIDIWKRKYQYEGETFDHWLDRVSGGNEDIRELIVEKKFLFGGRILANRGLNHEGRKVSLSNCYVATPPTDSIESIFDTAKKLARTYSYGGGIGVDISGLAPRGAKVNNAAKETSGAVSFMDLYSLVTETIGQNGRRGALMISLSVEHPDVIEFIKVKTDLTRVTKANISVRMTDDFMKAVKKDKEFRLHFTREATGETIEKLVKAHDVMRLIAECNYDYGEPGMLFWNRIESYNLLCNNAEFHYAGVNPCAEECLPAGGSCLLGSINLSEFVSSPFTLDASFNLIEFTNCIRKCVRGLNEVLDEGLPLHPLQEQRDSVRDWRQIGLGIMGLADMLIKLGIKYGSDECLKLCDKIGFEMANAAIDESANLANGYNSYPKYTNDVVDTKYFKNNTTSDTRNNVLRCGLRNSQLLTIAPTGTLSTMLGISGGIEPVFSYSYTRKTESLFGQDKYYTVYAKIVQDYLKVHPEVDPENLPNYFVDAMHLDYKQRIDTQAAWQLHIDASISSTVNVPEEFTVEEVENLYMYAWESGCKGITLFRNNCKRAGILTLGTNASDKKSSDEAIDLLKRGEIQEVNDNVTGRKRKLMTGCGTLHCEAFFDPNTGKLLETYLSKGSTGGCNNFMVGLSRMISLSARAGVSIDNIVDQLNSTGVCPSYAVRRATQKDTSKGSCCPMAVGNALIDMYNEVHESLKHRYTCNNDTCKCNNSVEDSIENMDDESVHEIINDEYHCPECGAELAFEGGCNICKNCGWSRCS